MKQYQDYLREIMANGSWQENRTGIYTLAIPGAMMKFDMADGFPAVTTKKLAFKQMKGELLGFIRGYDNAADFRELGCTIWDQNANENKQWLANPNRNGTDDLGNIYGVQWRRWFVGDYDPPLDQLAKAIETIIMDPTSRRILISAWRPDEFELMALHPCHVSYQFIVGQHERKLHLCMYQRSADSFLGVPFNIASASLLLHIVARLTGYTPGTFTHFLADAHIYSNHMEQCLEILKRDPMPLPKLDISTEVYPITEAVKYARATNGVSPWQHIDRALASIEPEHINLVDYQHHSALKGAMAV